MSDDSGEFLPANPASGLTPARVKREVDELVGVDRASRTRLTALKLLAEQSARERNAVKMQEVVDRIIDLALIGDSTAMTLVWKSMMTSGATDPGSTPVEKVQIMINAAEPLPPPKAFTDKPPVAYPTHKVVELTSSASPPPTPEVVVRPSAPPLSDVIASVRVDPPSKPNEST